MKTRVAIKATVGSGMIALCALGLLIFEPALAQGQPDQRGLDHARHAAAATAAGSTLECTDCHKQTKSGLLRDTPGHSWCFPTCHAPPAKKTGRKPYAVDPTVRAICESCHSAKSLSAAATTGSLVLRGTPSFPDVGDHLLSMSHASHSDPTCVGCHRFAAPPRPHSRCVSCHRRELPASNTSNRNKATKAVPMNECGGCHQPGGQRRVTNAFSVAAQFSHRRHNPRTSSKCERCHQGANQATTLEMPSPGKSSCTDCHTASAGTGTKTAFGTLSEDCRKCHRAPAALEERVRVPVVALKHTSHAAMKCTACHDQDGRFRAKAGHATCSNFDCHTTEMSSKTPTICSSCHVGNEPWLPQHIDLPRRASSDFGVRFEHRRHPESTADSVGASNDDASANAKTTNEKDQADRCRVCHVGDPSSRNDGLSNGHASCSGPSNCHNATASPNPPMSDCAGCHQVGSREARRASARGRQWSVAARFGHAKHQIDPLRTDKSNAPLRCESCHDVSASAPAGRDLAPPTKATCAQCHDGRVSFKLTGHACKRCHQAVSQPSTGR